MRRRAPQKREEKKARAEVRASERAARTATLLATPRVAQFLRRLVVKGLAVRAARSYATEPPWVPGRVQVLDADSPAAKPRWHPLGEYDRRSAERLYEAGCLRWARGSSLYDHAYLTGRTPPGFRSDDYHHGRDPGPPVVPALPPVPAALVDLAEYLAAPTAQRAGRNELLVQVVTTYGPGPADGVGAYLYPESTAAALAACLAYVDLAAQEAGWRLPLAAAAAFGTTPVVGEHYLAALHLCDVLVGTTVLLDRAVAREVTLRRSGLSMGDPLRTRAPAVTLPLAEVLADPAAARGRLELVSLVSL